ncbi:MAG: hypothetical protein MUF30_11950, partial [Burkholderiales bacterium]|nr:hypothetical protein [Burkholderiales bacterium]
WYKIVFGFILMTGAVLIWFGLMRRTRDAAGLEAPTARKRRGAADNGPNELERIVQAHRERQRAESRAAGGGTPGTVASPAADPPLAPGPLRTAAQLGIPDTVPAASLAARAAALAGHPQPEPPLVGDPNAAANDPLGSDQTIPGMPARPWLRADPGAAPREPRPLLKASHKLLYLLAKSALADHHVFPHVPLAAVAPDLGFVQPGHQFALVVCRADFTIVAAVDLRPAAEAWRLNELRDALRIEAGVAHVIFAAEYLPKRQALRKLILSPPGVPSSAPSAASEPAAPEPTPPAAVDDPLPPLPAQEFR